MRIISEASLRCFLWDVRRLLTMFAAHIPHDIHFISPDGFYDYIGHVHADKAHEVAAIISIITPYIPIVMTIKNAQDVMDAYFAGDASHFAHLERKLVNRSIIIFITLTMAANNAEWERVVDICCDNRAS